VSTVDTLPLTRPGVGKAGAELSGAVLQVAKPPELKWDSNGYRISPKVQVGDAPGLFCMTAEADGKQEASCPLAAANSLPLSDDVCGGFASVRMRAAGDKDGWTCHHQTTRFSRLSIAAQKSGLSAIGI
jgi:hypothetical protein